MYMAQMCAKDIPYWIILAAVRSGSCVRINDAIVYVQLARRPADDCIYA